MSMRLLGVLALIALTAGCAKSGTPTPTTPTPTTGTTVTIVSGASTMTTTAFSPNPISISVGTTVTWHNGDSTTHTSTGSSWDSGGIAPGGSFSHAFPTAGMFTYHCTIHPGMTGTVIVK